MSPEQAAGEEIDTRSDLYALGVVAYEMLAGQPPFQGPHRVVVSRHIAERPVPIERLRPETPRELAGAVMRALEKQPSDRWQTGEEFRQAIAGERATPSSTRIPAAGSSRWQPQHCYSWWPRSPWCGAAPGRRAASIPGTPS